MDAWIIIAGLVVGVGLLSAMSWKWCLPARMMAVIILVGAICAAGLGWTLKCWGLPPGLVFCAVGATQLLVYTGIVAYRFYRDPERTPPADPRAIVSPADGTIIYIRKLAPGSVLRCDKKGAQLYLDELGQSPLVQQELWQIGISMVFTDVHINRSPIAGKVVMAKHRAGKFLSLRIEEAVNVNERQTMLFDNGRYQVALVQIASRLVRRIVAYVQEGQELERAQRIGMIKFGSQVDLFLPVKIVPTLVVKEGDELVAGETVVGNAPV